DCERDFGVGMEHYVLRDAVDIFVDDRVVDDLGRAVDIGGKLAADSDLFFERIELYRPLVDVALADQRRIVLVIQRLRQRFLRRFLFRFIWVLRERAGVSESERQKQRNGVSEKSRSHFLCPPCLTIRKKLTGGFSARKIAEDYRSIAWC